MPQWYQDREKLREEVEPLKESLEKTAELLAGYSGLLDEHQGLLADVREWYEAYLACAGLSGDMPEREQEALFNRLAVAEFGIAEWVMTPEEQAAFYEKTRQS